VLRHQLTPPRWHAVGVVLERIAAAGYPDIAVAFAREWMRERPGSEMPSTEVLRSLVPLLKEARLI
jgi:hypothetical protein